jgi:hypothetical protein
LSVKVEDALLHGEALHLGLGGREEGKAAGAGSPVLVGCQFQNAESGNWLKRLFDVTLRGRTADCSAGAVTNASRQ